MTSVFTDQAIRVDPHHFAAVGHALAVSAAEAEAAITRLARIVDDYRIANQGPDIDAIVTAGTVLVDGLRSTVSGYDELAATFQRAGHDLEDVEHRSRLLVKEAREVPMEAMADASQALQRRFDHIRDDEDAIVNRVAAVLDVTPTGELSTADEAALRAVLFNPSLGGLDATAAFQLRLAISLLLQVDQSSIAITPAADTEASRKNLADIERILDEGGDYDVSDGQLNGIQNRLAGLTDGELQYVLDHLSDSQLDVLFHNVHSSGFWSNDWSDGQRQAFYDNLARVGRTGPPELWNRLGRFSPVINPDPSLGLPDGARENPEDARRWAALTWHPTTAPLWSPGDTPIDFADVRQGGVGDCYLIAAMITLARQDPDAIRKLITVNPNGTYTVTFADGSRQVVTPDVAVHPDGRPAFAHSDSGTAAWPQIIEKAYAQRNGGWGDDPGISGGNSNKAIEQLTGQKSHYIESDDLSLDDLADRWDRGEYLGLSTIDRPEGLTDKEWRELASTPDAFKRGDGTYDRLHQDHAFIVSSVDREAGTVSVLNPWDPSQRPLVLSFHDVQESVNGVYVNEPPAG